MSDNSTQVIPLSSEHHEFAIHLLTQMDIAEFWLNGSEITLDHAKELLEQYTKEKSCNWIITENDEPVGYGHIQPPAISEVYLTGYAIVPNKQGRGLGTKLLQHMTNQFLSEEIADAVYATIHPDNKPSIRIAEKAGFQPIPDQIIRGKQVYVKRKNPE